MAVDMLPAMVSVLNASVLHLLQRRCTVYEADFIPVNEKCGVHSNVDLASVRQGISHQYV